METSKRKLRRTARREMAADKHESKTHDSASPSREPANDVDNQSRATKDPSSKNQDDLRTTEKSTKAASKTTEHKLRSPTPSPSPLPKENDDRTFQQLVEDYEGDSKCKMTFCRALIAPKVVDAMRVLRLDADFGAVLSLNELFHAKDS